MSLYNILKGLLCYLAIEFVIPLLEVCERALMMRALPQLIISWLFAILMRMLSDIEDDAEWNYAENEIEDEWSNYSIGMVCLRRLVTGLGGNTIVLVAYQQLPAHLTSPRWQEHLAALVALAQIANGRSMEIPNLEQVVTMVLNSIESHPDHPRVRWAAINAAGQLYANLGPDLQFEYHSHVLPALAKAMCEDPDPRVRLAAINIQLFADLYPDYADLDPDYADLDPDLQFEYHGHVLPAGQLYADLDRDLQFEYHSHVLPALAEAMCEDPDPRVRLAAINKTIQLFADLDSDLSLTDPYRESVLQALHGAICDFEYLLVQNRAVYAMINISMKYPKVTPRYLLVTVGTLLELRRREDIASDQTRIRAIGNVLKVFEEVLPRDTWTSTFNSLRPDQQAEFRSIVGHGIQQVYDYVFSRI